MKEAYYFSHDSNARQDEKILMLRAEHGWEGYGIYWALVEMMFESRDTCLHHSKIKGISVSYNIDITILKSVINTCIEEELFSTENDDFWSESLRRRKDKFQEKKSQLSKAGKKGMAKRWASKGSDNDVITPLQDSDNVDITNHNKVKESKVKKSKVKKSKEKEVLLSDPTEKLKDEIHELTNTCNIKKLTLHDLDRLFSYIGLVDKEIIEAAIKKGEGKHVNYSLTILEGFYKEGIIKKEHLFKKLAPGKQNIRKDTLPSYISDQAEQDKIQKVETPEEEEARQKHIKEMMIELGEWDEDKN